MVTLPSPMLKATSTRAAKLRMPPDARLVATAIYIPWISLLCAVQVRGHKVMTPINLTYRGHKVMTLI